MSKVLVLGIGNVLMGDEGVGVHVVRHLDQRTLPEGIVCVDGGTGGFALLELLQDAEAIVLIDATVDDAPPGSVQRLEPKFARDYPRSLTAHDIGLKDLLDTFHLTRREPRVVLYAVSIRVPSDLTTDLTPEIAGIVPRLAGQVLHEASSLVSCEPGTPITTQ